MRVTTSMFYRQSTNTIQDLQSQLVRTQTQLSSGFRLLSSADDPAAATRLLQLDTASAQTEQYQRNSSMARNRLGLQEQSLTDVQNALFKLRDLAVQANNDTLDITTRGFIAAEADEVLNELVQVANTRGIGGNFIFSGFKEDTQPFSRSGDGVRYDGDQGQRQIQISDSRSVADGDSGADVFMNVSNGTGTFSVSAGANNTGTGTLGTRSLNDEALWDNGEYTIQFTDSENYDVYSATSGLISSGTFSIGDTIDVQGVSIVLTGAPDAGDEFELGPSRKQSVFETVQNFIDALAAPENPAGFAKLHNEMGNVLEDLDRGVDNVLEYRTRVGTRLQTIDAQEVSNTDFQLTLASATSELRDLDYAEAVTRLSRQVVGLEAAQQSFARIQGLSLFNLI
ncbi:MAG: flagellar hook-associated protein FlgL [Gammaproteobacteria bacterium]